MKGDPPAAERASPTVFCPGGTNARSQAIHCLERNQSRIRPVGHGLIPTRVANRPNGGALTGRNHTVPYGTTTLNTCPRIGRHITSRGRIRGLGASRLAPEEYAHSSNYVYDENLMK